MSQASRVQATATEKEGPNRFRTVVADPPWIHRSPGWKGSARNHYPLLSTPAIAALDVASICHDDSLLWLWAGEEQIRNGDAESVARAWGFETKAIVPWVKLQQRPVTPFNLSPRVAKETLLVWRGAKLYPLAWPNGRYGRVQTEYCLVGIRGKNLTASGKYLDRWKKFGRSHLAPVTGTHSEKPASFDDVIRYLSPGPRIELFARTRKPDFSVWGNEAENGLEVTLSSRYVFAAEVADNLCDLSAQLAAVAASFSTLRNGGLTPLARRRLRCRLERLLAETAGALDGVGFGAKPAVERRGS